MHAPSNESAHTRIHETHRPQSGVGWAQDTQSAMGSEATRVDGEGCIRDVLGVY